MLLLFFLRTDNTYHSVLILRALAKNAYFIIPSANDTVPSPPPFSQIWLQIIWCLRDLILLYGLLMGWLEELSYCFHLTVPYSRHPPGLQTTFFPSIIEGQLIGNSLRVTVTYVSFLNLTLFYKICISHWDEREHCECQCLLHVTFSIQQSAFLTDAAKISIY